MPGNRSKARRARKAAAAAASPQPPTTGSSAAALLAAGDAAAAAGNLDAACKSFERCYAMSPADGSLLVKWASALIRVGDEPSLRSAVKHCDAAFALDATWAKPLVVKARALARLKETAAARSAVTSAVVGTACKTDTRLEELVAAVNTEIRQAELSTAFPSVDTTTIAGCIKAVRDATLGAGSHADTGDAPEAAASGAGGAGAGTTPDSAPSDWESLLVTACACLTNLVFSDGIAKREAFAGGALQALVQAIDTFAKRSVAVGACLKVTKSLCFGNELAMEACVPLGVLRAAGDCLRCHTTDVDVVCAVVNLLCALCANNASNTAAAKALPHLADDVASLPSSGLALPSKVKASALFLHATLSE